MQPPSTPARPGYGDPVGQIVIPRVGLDAVVVEGDDESVLRVAVGHLPDTPLPWEDGNTALAGHRDTFFRPLRKIAEGDEIRLVTRHGTFEYRVRETLVVQPEDVWVLNVTDQPTLTLITCYPFGYVGPASQRFIVRADRVQTG